MVFSEGGPGTTIGAAQFALGVDLREFRAALDQAEQMARARAQHIQQALGNIPLGGGGAGGGGIGGTGGGGPFAAPPVNLGQGTSIGGGVGPAPSRQRGLAALDRAQQNEVRRLTAQGFPRELAEAHVRGEISDVELVSTIGTHAKAQAQIAQLMQRVQAQRAAASAATLAPAPLAAGGAAGRAAGGGGGGPAGPVYGPFPYNTQAILAQARQLYGYPPPGGAGGGGAGVGGGVAGGAGGAPGGPPPGGPPGGGGGGGPPGGGGGGGVFGLSPNTLIRVAAGLAGVAIGINIAAGAARLLHNAVADSFQSAQQLEQASRNVGIVWGSIAQQFTGPGAAAFAANPLTRGTTTEYLQTVAALQPLANQFGLTARQVQQLTIASGQLARVEGIDLSTASSALSQVLRGNLEAGQALGLNLVDQYGALRVLGLTYQELAARIGPAAASQRVFADAMQQANDRIARAPMDQAQQAMDRLGKAIDTTRNNLADLARTPFTVVVNVAGSFFDWLNAGGQGSAGGTQSPLLNAPPGLLQALGGGGGGGAPARRAIVGGQGQQAQQPAWLANLPPWFKEWLGIPSGQQQGQQPIGGPPQPVGGPGFVLPGQPVLVPPAGPAAGPPPPPYEHRLSDEDIQRMRDASTLAGARLAQSNAEIQARNAQARLDAIAAQVDQQRLGYAGEQTQLTQERLGLEDQLAPMLVQELSLQDQIRVITRENLGLTRDRLQAQLALIGPTRAVTQYTAEQQMAQQRIRVAILQQIAGQRPDYNIGQNIQELIGLGLSPQRAQAELAQTQGQLAVSMADLASQQDQLTKGLTALPQQQALQNLQLAGILPAQLRLADITAQSDAIDRIVQNFQLGFSPQIVAASQDLADARQREAEAIRTITGAQANVPGGAPIQITQTIDLGGLVVSPDAQAGLNQINQAASAGLLDALIRAANLTTPRVPQDVAAGR